ncbi:MAG: carboxypeptidase-like regulatory domain-containing protein [Desulfobulbaceae bacterium]|nr:carboxypeptidase-like regulatory domain-containing protein [Desulfobulbaceae bacterium]
MSAVQLEGIVLSEKGPVVDVVVTAYPDYSSLLNKQNGIRSTPGEKPGQYRLTVPEGKYYLVASGNDGSTPLFGYHGLNPIHVEEGYRWIPLVAMPVDHAECEPGFQGIGGRVLYKGRPVENSSVTVYPLTDEPFRGMGLFTNTVPEDGTFWFDLDPGRYVVIARKRNGGGAIGPISKGDLLCYFSGNPVQVPPAQSCMIDVPCYPRNDIDAFLAEDATDPRGKKEKTRVSASLREVDEKDSARLLAGDIRRPAFITGRVTTLTGFPLSSLYISAYPADGQDLFQMYVLRMKTEHMTRTDDKGFFRLELRSGSYYLVARERVGDAPIAGEYYGIYEGTPNHSIDLQPNEIKTGVHIIAESIMP